MYEVDQSGCDCCTGVTVETPVRITNIPGLPAIAYRAGTYTQFKASMQTRLSDSDLPGLQVLQTRQGDDFTIALLDAWAMIGDVLTFYQERIANESYKRTATERASLLELARLVKYNLQPGVAAATYLVFTLDETPGSPGQAIINTGTQAKSLPNPGEKPQTFETAGSIVAYARWNAIRPVLTQTQLISPSTQDILLQGTALNLKTGDAILIVDSAAQYEALHRVQSVQVDAKAQQTHVFFEGSQSALAGQPFANPQLFVLRTKASLFGYNAPAWNLMPPVVQGNYTKGKTLPHGQSDWTDWPFTPQDSKTVDLDRVYSQILKNTWVVIEQAGGEPQFALISQVQEVTDANYGLSLKVTRLLLDRSINQPQHLSDLRQVTVYAQAEPLTLADIPATAPITGNQIIVNGAYNDLGGGRLMVVTGQPVDKTKPPTSEFVTLHHVEPPNAGNYTILHLEGDGLSNSYDPTTVTINANVVPATQGESVNNEILGSGDATQTFQSFTLRQFPLTYVQAPTQEGRASTLSVSVDGIQWHEVDTFYGHGAYERIFVTHIGDDQKVTIQFGDGSTGARLPTGEDNVVASYRTGAGTQGLVKPGQISLLKTLPLGVKGVRNPLAPTGAVDPDTIDDARRNADNTVQTLGRIVSVDDYESFANSYAAVAKARATLIWNNQARAVYITIAGPATPDYTAGTPIEQGSGIYNKIYSGMRRASDPTVPFFLLSYTTTFFRLAAQVKVQPDYDPQGVLQAVEQAIRSAFSFDARTFSQPVYLKEVIAVTQPIPGVVTIHVYAFYRTGQRPDPYPGPDNYLDENMSLTAAPPQPQTGGSITPAELLLIDPKQPFDTLEEMP